MSRVLSYSGISTFEECPAKFAHSYIWMTPKPEVEQSPSLKRGLAFHNCIEKYLLGESDYLFPELEFYKEWFDSLREADIHPEMLFAFDENWQPQEYDNLEGHVRGAIDLVLYSGDTIFVYDWKTGKAYDSHSMQKNLYGLAVLLTAKPEIEKVVGSMVYLDSNTTSNPVTYPKTMLSSYKWVWDNKVERIRRETEYKCRPSWKCGFCPYSKKVDGPCPN